MGIDNRIVGAAITELRMRAGMTQQQLAAGLNVSHQAVSKWEKGAALPDIQTLLTLTQMFGVTMEQLLSGDIPGNDEPEEPAAEEAEEEDPLYGEPVPKAEEPSSIEKWIRGAIPDIQKAAGSAYRAVVDFGENIGNQINDAINRSAQKTAKSTDEAAGDVERKREELEAKRQAFEARRETFEQKQDALEALRDAHDEDLSEDAEAHLDEMEAELDQEEAQLDEMEDEIDQLENELEALEEDDEESDEDDDDDDDDNDDDDNASADEAQKTASDAGSGLNNLTIDQVIQMAPFMTRAKLDEIAYSLLKDNANFNQLVRLAPFLSRDTLSRIAEGVLLSPANKKNIAALAPFLGNDQLYRLLLNNLDCLDWELMKRAAPFLKRSMVDSLMTYLTTGTKPVYESKPEKTASGCFTETIQQFASDLGSIAGDLIDYGKRASEPFRQKAAAPASAETPKPSDAPKPTEAPKPRQTAKAPSEMRDKVARTALNAGNWDWLSANLDTIGDRSLVLEIAMQAIKQPEDHSELVCRAALLLDSAQQEALFHAVLDANAWDTVIGLKSVADETIADLIISRAASADESRRAEAYHAIEVFAPLMSRSLLEQITEKALAEDNWPLINALTEVF